MTDPGPQTGLRILFLTPQLPYPPRQGTALRNYHLIAGLADRHAVSVLSFLELGQEADVGPLDGLCRQIDLVPIDPRSLRRRTWDLVCSRRPDMALRLWSRPFARLLSDRLHAQTYDVVQIEGIEMAPYLSIVEGAPRRPTIVFDDHNAEYVLQQRAFQTDLRIPRRWHAAAYSFVQWRRLRRFEADVCRRADRVVAVSQTDRLALERLAPGLSAHVIPNCVRTAAYAAPPADHPPVPRFTVLFTGKMDFRPNVDAALWFGREIWPLIRAERQEATWGIVGKSPHPRLDVLRSDRSITVVGEVPDMLPYLHAAELYVIPLRMGGGTRFKLVEAMAAGLPVVSTTIGAEGVPAEAGQALLIADDPAGFAAVVRRLLDDATLGDTLRTNALRLVRERYDWRTAIPALERVYGLTIPSVSDTIRSTGEQRS